MRVNDRNRWVCDTLSDFINFGMHESSAYRNLKKGRVIDMGPVGVEWTPIPGYRGFEVTRCGLVRCVRSIQGAHLGVLPANDTHGGYVRHGFSVNGTVIHKLAHELVARTFIGDPPPGHIVNHKNGIKSDNHVDNLEWVTHMENNHHAWDTGLCTPPVGELNGSAKLTPDDISFIRASSDTGPSLARHFGVSRVQINKIKRREAWTHVKEKSQ